MTDKEYFYTEYKLWKDETMFLSTGNYDNDHFRNIVAMGEKAIPYILEVLEKEKIDMIYYACELIYPDEVKYDGYVPLKFCCKVWRQILKMKLNNITELKLDTDEISEQNN